MNLPPRPEPVELGMDFDKGWDGVRAYGHTEDQLRARELEIIEACKVAAIEAMDRMDTQRHLAIAAAIEKLKEQL